MVFTSDTISDTILRKGIHMKKIKKTMALAVMMVMLIGSCMTASAATNACDHADLTFYDKTEVHREFWFSHTEQHGPTTVMCDVYKVEYLIRYRCDACGALPVSTTKIEEVHVNK